MNEPIEVVSDAFNRLCHVIQHVHVIVSLKTTFPVSRTSGDIAVTFWNSSDVLRPVWPVRRYLREEALPLQAVQLEPGTQAKTTEAWWMLTKPQAQEFKTLADAAKAQFESRIPAMANAQAEALERLGHGYDPTLFPATEEEWRSRFTFEVQTIRAVDLL